MKGTLLAYIEDLIRRIDAHGWEGLTARGQISAAIANYARAIGERPPIRILESWHDSNGKECAWPRHDHDRAGKSYTAIVQVNDPLAHGSRAFFRVETCSYCPESEWTTDEDGEPVAPPPNRKIAAEHVARIRQGLEQWARYLPTAEPRQIVETEDGRFAYAPREQDSPGPFADDSPAEHRIIMRDARRMYERVMAQEHLFPPSSTIRKRIRTAITRGEIVGEVTPRESWVNMESFEEWLSPEVTEHQIL